MFKGGRKNPLITALKNLFNGNVNQTEIFIKKYNITSKKYESAITYALSSGKNLKKILIGNTKNNEENNFEIPIPNNSLPNRNMTRMIVEPNLHNYDSTQCYRNSVLHLLLSIIQYELIHNRNGNANIESTFNSLFNSRRNINANNMQKINNLKIFVHRMLMKQRPEYENVFNTYYNITKMNGIPNSAVNDCVAYFKSILPIVFSPKMNNLIDLKYESIPNFGNFVMPLEVSTGTNLEVGNIIHYIEQYGLNKEYIILPIELHNPMSDININLNEPIIVNSNRYIVNDIIYFGSSHYVSLNRRNDVFYLYNDLDNRSFVNETARSKRNQLKNRILKPLSITRTSAKKNIIYDTGSIKHLTSERVYGYNYSTFNPRLIMLKRID
jgi:hypothetical protein